MYFSMRDRPFSLHLDFLLYRCYSFDMALKNKTWISRPWPASRLTLLPKTQARTDFLDWDKNFQKLSHIFWGRGPTTKLFLVIATAWGSFSFPFFLFDKLVIQLCMVPTGKLTILSLFFYLQSISSLSSFLTKIQIRLRYRKISTMMFLSIKRIFYTSKNN